MMSAENIKTAEAWLDIDESPNGRQTVENLVNFRNVLREDAEAIVPMLLQKKASQQAATASQAEESVKGAAVAVAECSEPISVEETEPEYLDSKDMLGYLRLLFEPGDWVNIQLIHQTETYTDKSGNVRAKTQDNYTTLEEALLPSTVTSASKMQDEGWNVYVAMNAFTPGLKSRREKDIGDVRNAYIEFDESGEIGLTKIEDGIDAGIVQAYDFVLQSSPGKFYVIWRVKDFTVQQQKALNKSLQMRYGSDPQSVDAARVLRLPGTRNLKPKYSPTPVVEIFNETVPHYDRCTPADFKIEVTVRQPVNREAAPEKVQTRMSYYEQACDDAGVDAGDVQAKNDGSYSYTVACPNYEQHTAGGKFDASVWISPSGAISFGCFHSHCDGKDWKTFYRPLLEEQAKKNGFEGFLK